MTSKKITRFDLRTEKTENLDFEEIYNFFVPPLKDMQIITKIKNTYLVGHKGSGKSIILKYLSHPFQLSRFSNNEDIEFDSKALGLLMRCDVGKFGGMREPSIGNEIDPMWIRHFTHVFNLCAVDVILEAILEIIDSEQFSLNQKEIQFFLKKLTKKLRIKSLLKIDKLREKIDVELDDLLEEYQNNMLSKKKRFYTDHTLLFECRKILKNSFQFFKKREIVFLLDEYNELTNSQQSVINDMIKLRQPIFKMSTLPYGHVRTRTKKEFSIDIDQDFDMVYLANQGLTPFSSNLTNMREFFNTLWEKRIKNLPISDRKITEIFQVSKNNIVSTKKKKTKIDIKKINQQNYCGFSNYVLLSSGNPKTFLDLLQATFELAFEKKINLKESNFTPDIQLKAIQEFSKDHRDDIINSDNQLGNGLYRLVEFMGKSLKKKCIETGRNYRMIIIKNNERLSDLAYRTIKLGLQKSWLFQNKLERISRDEKIRLDTLTLNNVLMPSFELPLASQQTWELDAKEVEKIIKGEEFKEKQSLNEIISVDTSLKKENPFELKTYQYLNDIKKLIEDDKIVLFIGSGLSTFAGMPSAEELSEKICYELGIDKNEIESLYHMTEYFCDRRSEPELYEFLQNEFHNRTTKLNLHQKLIGLGITRTITTNWDNIIEECYKEKGIQLQLMVNPYDLATLDEKKHAIFKMHGDFEHKDLMVMTKSQYENYSTSHKSMLSRINVLLQNKGVLFLGYSLKDPNFNQIRNTVINEIGKLKKSYAIFSEIDDKQKVALEKQGIQVIESDFEPIIDFLSEDK